MSLTAIRQQDCDGTAELFNLLLQSENAVMTRQTEGRTESKNGRDPQRGTHKEPEANKSNLKF